MRKDPPASKWRVHRTKDALLGRVCERTSQKSVTSPLISFYAINVAWDMRKKSQSLAFFHLQWPSVIGKGDAKAQSATFISTVFVAEKIHQFFTSYRIWVSLFEYHMILCCFSDRMVKRKKSAVLFEGIVSIFTSNYLQDHGYLVNL